MIRTACLATCLLATPALALDQQKKVAEFVHTSWTEKDGAPADIRALAQTTDGYLWLGTVTGLFRFDGVKFVRFQTQSGESLPGVRVASLLASRDGALWIVWGTTRVSRLLHGRLTSYSDRDGLPPTQALAESKDGELVAATSQGLARFVDGQWKDTGARWGLSPGPVRIVYFDAAGTLWIFTQNGVQYLPAGQNRFVVSDETVKGALNFAQAPDGTVWTSEIGRSAHTVRRAGDHDATTEVRVGATLVLFDRNGSLWIATYGDGLRRVAYPDHIRGRQIAEFGAEAEAVTVKDGLSSDFVRAAIEDREGNLWFGSLKGLDRIRQGAFTPVAIPNPDLPRGLVATRDGSLRLFSTLPVDVLNITARDEQQVVFRSTSAAMCEDQAGAVWSLADHTLFRYQHGQLVPVPPPASAGLAQLGGIACDPTGGIWMADRVKGLFHFIDGVLTAVGPAADGYAYLFADRRGRLWAAAPDRIALEDHGRFQSFDAKDGVLPGVTMTFFEDRAGHIWAGGEGGLSAFDDGRFRTFSNDNGFPARSVYGLAEDEQGDWWVASDAGVLRIPAGDASQALADRTHRIRYERFDVLDGLPGHVRNDLPMPVVARTTDGRIWFAASGGIAYVDPRQVPRNSVSPPVLIEAIRVDGKAISPADGLTLSPGTSDIEIDYTALSLTMPERVQFRYRLQGRDGDWRDAGPRRQAFFTGLSPRTYRFRVIASNNSGVWNEAGAALDFSIAPSYYQTTWFAVASLAAIMTLLGFAYQLRLRQMAQAFEARLQERVNERMRIARDLHDTLLQSFHGVLFRFQAADNLLPDRPADAKRHLARAIEQAEDAITEGRDAVQQLRASTTVANDLAEAISALGEQLTSASGSDSISNPTVEVAVDGTSRRLHPIVRDDIFRIASEAVRNAYQHAGARRIEIGLRYDDREFRLRVRDDGKGIDPAVLQAGRVGHFGVPGMRERAELLGGHLEVWSEVGLGAEVSLTIPAAAAYSAPRARGRWWFGGTLGPRTS